MYRFKGKEEELEALINRYKGIVYGTAYAYLQYNYEVDDVVADKVKLLIFGSVSDDIKGEFDALLEKYPDIIYIGWIDSDKVYDFFFATYIVDKQYN